MIKYSQQPTAGTQSVKSPTVSTNAAISPEESGATPGDPDGSEQTETD